MKVLGYAAKQAKAPLTHYSFEIWVHIPLFLYLSLRHNIWYLNEYISHTFRTNVDIMQFLQK
jgi:hypothetical protein